MCCKIPEFSRLQKVLFSISENIPDPSKYFHIIWEYFKNFYFIFYVIKHHFLLINYKYSRYAFIKTYTGMVSIMPYSKL